MEDSYTHLKIAGQSFNDTGNYTHIMNGTSAATPMVAGVAALILEANPALTWREVRYILATTARKNDPADSGWQTNGAETVAVVKVPSGAATVSAPSTPEPPWPKPLPLPDWMPTIPSP